MNGHLDGWIDAYLDGEVTTQQKRQAEAHLAHCPACASLLEQRRALSVLLHEAPAASDLKAEKQFVAEVGLRLPNPVEGLRLPNPVEGLRLPNPVEGLQLSRRQPAAALPRLSPSLVWQLIPVGLLLALIFVQTALTLSGILSFIPAANKTLVSQAPGLAALQVMPGAVSNLLGLLGVFDFINWNWLTGMVFLAAISLAYLGWLASWWARNQQTANQL